MKKIIITLILVLLLVAVSSAISVVPVSVNQKLKAYADVNIKKSLEYSSFEVLKIEKFDGFVVIYFNADGKEQRWFKPTTSFNKLTK